MYQGHEKYGLHIIPYYPVNSARISKLWQKAHIPAFANFFESNEIFEYFLARFRIFFTSPIDLHPKNHRLVYNIQHAKAPTHEFMTDQMNFIFEKKYLCCCVPENSFEIKSQFKKQKWKCIILYEIFKYYIIYVYFMYFFHGSLFYWDKFSSSLPESAHSNSPKSIAVFLTQQNFACRKNLF